MFLVEFLEVLPEIAQKITEDFFKEPLKDSLRILWMVVPRNPLKTPVEFWKLPLEALRRNSFFFLGGSSIRIPGQKYWKNY